MCQEGTGRFSKGISRTTIARPAVVCSQSPAQETASKHGHHQTVSNRMPQNMEDLSGGTEISWPPKPTEIKNGWDRDIDRQTPRQVVMTPDPGPVTNQVGPFERKTAAPQETSTLCKMCKVCNLCNFMRLQSRLLFWMIRRKRWQKHFLGEPPVIWIMFHANEAGQEPFFPSLVQCFLELMYSCMPTPGSSVAWFLMNPGRSPTDRLTINISCPLVN